MLDVSSGHILSKQWLRIILISPTYRWAMTFIYVSSLLLCTFNVSKSTFLVTFVYVSMYSTFLVTFVYVSMYSTFLVTFVYVSMYSTFLVTFVYVSMYSTFLVTFVYVSMYSTFLVSFVYVSVYIQLNSTMGSVYSVCH